MRAAAARGMRPPPERSLSEWADEERILGGEEGPKAGRWETATTPYLREPMDVLGLRHPSRRVTLMASAQVGKTQVELNFAGQIATETPATVLWVLPTWDEAKNFNRDKLDPLIQNTPAVRERIAPVVSRDDAGSTVLRKKFPGGLIELTGANSSRGLQSRTRRVIMMDEVSEFPADAGGRGDPVAQAEARTIAWKGREKIVEVSTPGLEGECRITASYEKGSKGRFMVACPQCGHRQELQYENLKWDDGRPEGAWYLCEADGYPIQHSEKAEMLRRGEWVHERPELVVLHASYRLNSLYSPFVGWDEVARQAEKVRDDPTLLKPFTQQWLGRPFKPTFDVPKAELLWERREGRSPRRVPPGVLFLVGATDVQGDRLEWALYGFDRHFGMWWIDGGVLEGDPNLPQVWKQHDDLLDRRWPDAWGRQCCPVSWGIDSGYLSQQVYRYVQRNGPRAEPRVFALDGRDKWGEPPIGAPSTRDIDYEGRKIGAVRIWPVGTWDLKSELASALHLTVNGPDSNGVWPQGAMRFPRDGIDLGFFQQLTAEACIEVGVPGRQIKREWRKISARNEQWDLAVYARALARHETVAFTDAEWDQLAAQRQGPPDAPQRDMAALWAPPLKEAVAAPGEAVGPPVTLPAAALPVVVPQPLAVPPAPIPPPAPPVDDYFEHRDWFSHREGGYFS
jgi:phage terminase large subunit GpA-like protein